MGSGKSSVASPDIQSPVKKTVAALVRQWKEVATSVHELAAFGQMMENMTQDLRLSPAELRALAAMGTNAAKQLPCFLEALRINIQTLAEQEPLVLRDLQRVCTLCDHKCGCDRDIAAGALATHYQSYCANADTVRALKLDPKFNSK
jgi:uncharacterized Fe-S radical SAM superfamily protein PflX